MSVEADLQSALAPLVGGRCWPEHFPHDPPRPVWPAIRYLLVSAVPVAALCGDTGDDAGDTRVQIDCVAETFKGSRSLRSSVMAAMTVFSPPAVLGSSGSDYDQDTDTYRQVLDYTIYKSSS